ncbi:MAG: glycosyltransferase 87 family protein [Candidatus Heimdallarchaeota archaeon]
MIISQIFVQIKNRLGELWNYNIIRYTLLIHGLYFILSILITLFFFRNQNDFLVYYEVGEVVLTDINNLYTTTYNWPFRYLPLTSLYFVPFYLMGFSLGFIMFNLINLTVNIFICIFLYKIIMVVRKEDHEKNDKRVILYICLYLMSLPQIFNYILGQISLYITLLILISLFIFIKREGFKWNLIGSFILGISINLKPITLLLIPFILIVGFDYQRNKLKVELRTSIVRIIGVIIPVSFNLILFLIYPDLFTGFISRNFTGADTVILNHSFSITKLISNLLLYMGVSPVELPLLPIFFSVLLMVGILGFIIYVFRRDFQFPIVYGYSYGLLIMLLTYFDSWNHHLLNFIPLLIIILFGLSRNSEITRKFIKPSLFFLNFFDLAFMGIWFLIQDWFPFNFESTIFLLATFYGISKYCLKGDLINQKS